jgi:hypothetical protein
MCVTPRTASARSLCDEADQTQRPQFVAVASTTVTTSQRRQPFDLRVLNDANAVNVNKLPSRLVGIKKATRRNCPAVVLKRGYFGSRAD